MLAAMPMTDDEAIAHVLRFGSLSTDVKHPPQADYARARALRDAADKLARAAQAFESSAALKTEMMRLGSRPPEWER